MEALLYYHTPTKRQTEITSYFRGIALVNGICHAERAPFAALVKVYSFSVD